MKTFLNLILIIFVLFIILLLTSIILIFVFHLNPQGSGSNDELRSVKESKEYGVFISEYYSPEGYISLPDNDKLYIMESWVEHDWIYNNWSKPTIVGKGVYGLYVVFKEPIILNAENQENSYQWKNGVRYFDGKDSDYRGKLNQFSIWSNDFKIEDTLKIYVSKYHSEEKRYDTLTSFILVKKK